MIRILVFCLMGHLVFSQTPLEKVKQFQANGKIPEATSILLSVKKNTKEYAEARFMLGRFAFDKKDFEEAMDYFEEAVEENSTIADYHRWLAKAYSVVGEDANIFRQGILAPKIKDEWEKVIELTPGAVDAYTSLIVWHLVVPSMLGGSIEEAKKLTTVLKKYDIAEAYYQLGKIYVHEKDYNKAFEAYDQAVAKKPDYIALYYQFGKTSALSGLRFQDGEMYLRKYLEHPPLPDESSHAVARMRLGQIYEKQGKKAEAIQYYEAALKEEKSLKGAREGLERMKNVK